MLLVELKKCPFGENNKLFVALNKPVLMTMNFNELLVLLCVLAVAMFDAPVPF